MNGPGSGPARPPSPPRRQRACAPCTKAKARCYFQKSGVEGQSCRRCENLHIECLSQATRSLRKPRRVRDGDRDVSLSDDSRHVPASTTAILGQQDSHQLPREQGIPLSRGRQQETRNINIMNSDQSQPTALETRLREARPDPKSVSLYNLTWTQTERILEIFREKYIPYFPFAQVDEGKSAENLFADNPCLFRAILLVAAPLPESRLAKIKRNVLAYLGQHMFVEDEQNLDLLQGLLVVIAWAHVRRISDEQVTSLTHLALGYAHSFGLTKIPREALQEPSSDANREDMLEKARRLQNSKPHSAEEQKTLLGVFCILSANSNMHTRRNPLNSPYINHCCTSLIASSPSPSMLLLERTVKMIQLSDKLTNAFGEAHERTHARPFAFLLEGSGRPFRSEIDRAIENAAHPDLQEHQTMFHLWKNYLLTRLYEPVTRVKELESEGVGPSMYRSLCLRNCLDAVKAYFELLLAEPPETILYRSVLTSEQAAFVMLMATRLLLIDTPDWDVAVVRTTLDLVPILDRILERIEEAEKIRLSGIETFAREMGVGGVAEEEAMGGWLGEMAKKTRWLREGFKARLEGRMVNGFLEDEDSYELVEEDKEEEPNIWVMGMWGNMSWGFG